MLKQRSLRAALSSIVTSLRDLRTHGDTMCKMLESGVTIEEIDGYYRFLDSPKYRMWDGRLKKDIRDMFELGGIISGGAALALALGHKTKDIDFYFNNDVSFVKAYLATYDNPYIDVCWYINETHELHDIAVVMCNAHADGAIEITPQAQEALDTKVCTIYPENFIWPDRSVKRLMKYHNRYGMRYRAREVVAIAALYDIEEDLIKQALSISVM